MFTTRGDATYIIDAVNINFPDARLTLQDIESSWAGLRPLIHEEGKSASELSRKDEIFESSSGLISIAGGKLTGYRKMAERVVSLVIKKYFEERPLKKCQTSEITLTEKAIRSTKEVAKFIGSVKDRIKPYNFPPHTARYLVENYGFQANYILSDFEKLKSDVDPDLALLKAELSFCLRYEMVCTLLDFFVRRTGMINFDIHRVQKWKNEILAECKIYFNWSEETSRLEMKKLEDQLKAITTFQ